MAKARDPYTAPGEDSLHGDSADAADAGIAEVNPVRTAEDTAELAADESPEQPDWLQFAKDAFIDSDDFMESSLRNQWEKNERAFQNQHPPGSKYLSEQYKGRSRLFRPKTRSNIRQSDAALATAMFSNEDVISVKPMDENDKAQMASADIVKEILQYRLTTPNQKVGIPWFVTVVGAGQDAQKYGIVCSKQWWEYKTRTETTLQPAIDEYQQPVIDEEGRPLFNEIKTEKVILDRPMIDIFEPENVRIDRGADWRDPINTSPFAILMHPMYIHEVKSRMKASGAKGNQKPWRDVSSAQLKVAGTAHSWDTTRSQREGNREDSKESEIAIDDFNLVWVHENFMTWDDREWVYYTAGTHYMLSDPILLEEAYPHCDDGMRPITMGCMLIEAHKVYPPGKPQLTEGLQSAANEIANLRIDNVKLALNKRYLVPRGKQVDLRSLLRNVSGSVTLVTDVEKDVKVLETRDVTGSSYQEQDRINADFDEIAGGMSTGSVQTNRNLNETVGGMEMLAGAGSNIQELDLRTFIETWAEATLAQVIKMIQTYEDDNVIVALAANKADVFQRYGVSEITDEMLKRQLTTKVNVGIGATDPERRLNRFVTAAKTVGELLGEQIMTKINIEEVIKEVFGAVGYRDGKRFFNFGKQDPLVEMLMKKLQEMQQEMERRQLEADTKKEVAQIGAMAKVATTEMEGQTDLEITRMREEGNETVEAMRAIGDQQTAARTASATAARDRANNIAKFETEMMKGIQNAKAKSAANGK